MTEITTEIPEGVEATYKEDTMEVTNGNNTVTKKINHAQIAVKVEENQVTFTTNTDKKNIVSIAKAFKSHVRNMIEGLENPHVYKMKGVYAHFPMNIKKQGNEVVVENFMGERHPRKAEIEDNVNVKIDGEEITLESSDKEAVAQTAARIEQLSKKGNRDPRTFQDGIYIIKGDEQ